ncbi:anaerobic sulfatase maturase [Robertmurraya korlensis]|uniref:anaerobic sulfatase maturase n=1 Tax=Robertmurraya korlensis TaxID=519977 RepID=UPI00082475DC|nr:anaerobic sulfatase maturase [Robertmurraya korlensis]
MATESMVATTSLSGVMWKTVSEACNLACDYCYYSRCNGRPDNIQVIEDDVLEKFIKEYMTLKRGVVPFVWQGGEPLLAGLNFFKKVVRLQAKYAPKNTIISNSIQTNGTLITEEWANFFREYKFFVGVSVDGPESINDSRRVTGSGKGSYRTIMKGIDCLRAAGVEFNILTVLHENNINHAKELMDFYKEHRFPYIQFIPCMDFLAQDITQTGSYLITPKEYGDFLCKVFDIWYNNRYPEMSIRFFDNMLAVYLNEQPQICTNQKSCPKTLVFEQNGDAYPCDFFIDQQYKLGNIRTDSLEEILSHSNMDKFQAMKPLLPNSCKTCEFLKLCHGGCPRNRITENNVTGVDYFCSSFKQVYRYAHDRMLELAINIKRARMNELKDSGYRFPERNEQCLCGSGKKFKKCCGPLLV